MPGILPKSSDHRIILAGSVPELVRKLSGFEDGEWCLGWFFFSFYEKFHEWFPFLQSSQIITCIRSREADKKKGP